MPAPSPGLPSPAVVLDVSAFNRLAKDLIESSLPLVWVRGEISNFVAAASGHCYFSLKDAGAQVRCVLFRHRMRQLDWRPGNGIEVEVRAVATLYEPRGEFQLTVETLRRAGLGALYEAFARLKAKLEREGLFDPARKRPLPDFPRAVGVITSPSGAAVRDVLTTLARRMPSVPVVIYPTLVQGAQAPAGIVAALAAAAARGECDVLIVCRGGGSIEDLWAFNDEAVARAIAASPIPVVCGVGHETDFTIADFVADLRAPTPTAAAAAAVPDAAELRRHVRAIAERMRRAGWRTLERSMQRVDQLGRRLIDPRERIAQRALNLEHLAARLASAVGRRLDGLRWEVTRLSGQLRAARPQAGPLAARLQRAALQLAAASGRAADARAARVELLGARLAALDPHAVLERGYAIAARADGRIVRDGAALAPGDLLTVTFARGRADTQVLRAGDDDRTPGDGITPTA